MNVYNIYNYRNIINKIKPKYKFIFINLVVIWDDIYAVVRKIVMIFVCKP